VGLLSPAGQALGEGFSGWAAGPEMDVQSRVTAVLDEARQSELRERTQTAEGRARLLSVAGPGAGQWLASTPLLHILRMEHSLFQTALTMQVLGLPHPVLAGIGRCACGELLESDGASGRHLLRCSTGPERTAVHDRVRDAVYGIMREGGLRTTRDQLGLMPIVEGETRGRVIDLVGVDPQGRGGYWETRRSQTVVGQGFYRAWQCRRERQPERRRLGSAGSTTIIQWVTLSMRWRWRRMGASVRSSSDS
jgi:hypothetical protein